MLNFSTRMIVRCLSVMCIMVVGDAKVIYPLGVLDFEEGTIEFSYRLELPVRESFLPTEKYKGIAKLIDVSTPEGGFSFHYFGGAAMAPEAGHGLSNRSDSYDINGLLCGKIVPEPDEWTHVALVWKENEIACWINGQFVEKREFNVSTRLVYDAFGTPLVTLGGKKPNRSAVIFDNLRISKVARNPEEFVITDASQPVDPYTSVWDTFDGVSVDGEPQRSRPQWLSNGEYAEVTSSVEIVDGIQGDGLLVR